MVMKLSRIQDDRKLFLLGIACAMVFSASAYLLFFPLNRLNSVGTGPTSGLNTISETVFTALFLTFVFSIVFLKRFHIPTLDAVVVTVMTGAAYSILIFLIGTITANMNAELSTISTITEVLVIVLIASWLYAKLAMRYRKVTARR